MPKSLGLTHSARVAFTPLGGCLGLLQTGQGGLFCPMLARVARVARENPCRAGPEYLCSRQVLRLGQGYQLARVGQGGAWAGLWVAVLPHKGQGEPEGNPGKLAARLGGPRETLASPSQPEGNPGQLVGPWAELKAVGREVEPLGACCRISRRLTRNRGHLPANVKK